MYRSVWIASAALSLFAGTALAQIPAMAVRAARAELQQVQLHHRVTGSLRAVARGDVAALEEGRVIEVAVREGALVHQGDLIARVDARRLEAQRAELVARLQTIEAQIEQRNVELSQARRDLVRLEQLVERKAVTVQEHQHRETEVKVAESQLQVEERRLDEIQSQLQLLDVRLDDVVVRAPYDGRVVERHAEPGEWIRAGEPFVTLVSVGNIEAWFDVPERYSHKLAVDERDLRTAGTVIGVEIHGGDHAYRAIFAKRVPDVDARTRTFPLVLTLDDAEGELTPGMSVDAWLPMGSRESRLTVPKDAVVRNGRTAHVYKALEQDGHVTAMQSPVTVLFETGDVVVVDAETLSAGDFVIVEGNERLMPGAPITIAEADKRSR